MENLKLLAILCLITNINSYNSCSYNYLHPKKINTELTHKKLFFAIQNTPHPSSKLLENWLKIAFEKNYQDIIRYILLNTRFNLNYQDKLGNTWLHYAALLGNPEFVKILLQKDISRNKRNIFGDTPLHQNAKYNPNLKIIKLLFMTGAKPGITNNDGQTALDAYLSNNPNPDNKIVTMLKKHCMCYFLP